MASSESANPENEKITSTLTSSPLSLFGPNNRLRSGDRRSLCLAWTREVLKPIRKICEYSPKRD